MMRDDSTLAQRVDGKDWREGADHVQRAEYIDIKLVPHRRWGVFREHRAVHNNARVIDEQRYITTGRRRGFNLGNIRNVQLDRNSVRVLDRGRLAGACVDSRRATNAST